MKLWNDWLAHVSQQEYSHPFRVNDLNSNLFHASDYWCGFDTEMWLHCVLLFVLKCNQYTKKRSYSHGIFASCDITPVWYNATHFSDWNFNFKSIWYCILKRWCKNWCISIRNSVATYMLYHIEHVHGKTIEKATGRELSKSEVRLICSVIGFCGCSYSYMCPCNGLAKRKNQTLAATRIPQWATRAREPE